MTSCTLATVVTAPLLQVALGEKTVVAFNYRLSSGHLFVQAILQKGVMT